MIANQTDLGPRLITGAAKRLRLHLNESIAVKQRVLVACERDILVAAARIVACLRNGGKILLCGNGGSAADCQHLAAEFVSVLTQDFPRPGLPAIALTTDTSILTAIGNDFGFEGIFERQVQALGRPGDVLLGISTSGNSENILRAIRCAKESNLGTIALTGAPGAKIAISSELAIRVPSTSTMHIQEAHITIGHILCDVIERSIANKTTPI